MLDAVPDSLPVCRVSLLGAFQVDWRVPSLNPTAWEARTSARSLFLLLLCAPQRCASRRMLAGILWPETTDEHARDSLRSAIKVLTKVLTTTDGQRLLSNQANGELLSLGGQDLIWTDVDALLRLVEQASAQDNPEAAFPLWQEAAALLRGDLLVADRDHEWSRHAWLKTRLRQVAAARRQVVRHLSQHYLRQGERDRAETLLLTHLIRFPADQDALYRLMKLLIEVEAFQEALVPYRQCERALKEQGHEPAPPLQALAQRLLDLDLTGLAQAKARHLQQSLTTPHPLAELLVVPASFATSLSSQTLLPFSNAIKQGILEAVQELEGADSLDTSRRILLQQILSVAGAASLPPMALVNQETLKQLLSALPQSSASHEGMPETLGHFNEAYHPRGKVMVIEESYPQWVTTMETFWQLYFQGGIPVIEVCLSNLVSELTIAASQPSHLQKQVAALASQTYQMSWLLALQRQDFSQALLAIKQAYRYGELAEDPNLLLAALVREAHVYYHVKNPIKQLNIHEQAMQYADAATPLASSWLYLLLAENHAHLQHAREAESFLELAHKKLPADPTQDQAFSYVRMNSYLFSNFETICLLHLNQPQKALDHLDLALSVADPRCSELLNHRLAALYALSELDEICHQFPHAVEAASQTNSLLRRHEIGNLYSSMVSKWHREHQVRALATLLQ